MPRTKHKVDANHSQIMKAFRDIGYVVFDTSIIGRGFPDLVISKQDSMGVERNYLIEVKPNKKAKLTEAEQDFASGWRGQYDIITSVDDVIRFNAEQWGKK